MIKYLAGPIIGALIGYCTNYIAVKMLFYPKNEVRVFGKKLPFTPGAIPKGKPRLAKAIGNIVGKTLVTKEDIEEKLLTDDVADKISGVVMQEFSGSIKDLTARISGSFTEEKLQIEGQETEDQIEEAQESQMESGQTKEKLARFLSNQITDALSKIDLSEVIATKGGAIVKEKVQGTMLQMFLTDDLIQSVTAPIGAELQTMIATQGSEYVHPLVLAKLDELEEQSISGLLSEMEIEEADIKKMISGLFMKVMKPCIGNIVDSLDLSSIAEEKVNQMSVDELEDMVLSVMKKELNTIVRLGALIGFLLGILNIFI